MLSAEDVLSASEDDDALKEAMQRALTPLPGRRCNYVTKKPAAAGKGAAKKTSKKKKQLQLRRSKVFARSRRHAAWFDLTMASRRATYRPSQQAERRNAYGIVHYRTTTTSRWLYSTRLLQQHAMLKTSKTFAISSGAEFDGNRATFTVSSSIRISNMKMKKMKN